MQKVYLKSGSYIARRAAKNLKVDQVAIVIWNTIFIFGTSEEDFLANKHWLRHELEHVRQWRRYGFLRYIWKYLVYSLRFGYENNPFEREARASEKDLEGIDDFQIIRDEDRESVFERSMKSTASQVMILSLGLLMGCMVIAKAWQIPVTHDEAGQILYYARLSVYDIFMFTNPWPTNHILNSLLIKLFTALMGDHLMVERLPNILAYVFLFYYSYRWSRLLFAEHLLGIIFTVALLFWVDYSFDFFSLARGYGLALSFQVAAMYHLFVYHQTERLADFWSTQLLLLLMFLSNFSWLSLWLCIEIAFVGYMLYRKTYRRLPLVFLAGLIHLAFIYNPAKRMSETGQFIYWQSNGFYQDTFQPLVRLYFYEQKFVHFTPDLIFAIISIFSVSLVVYTFLFRNRQKLWLFPALFFGASIVTMLQNKILDTPFLTGRTALLFYPLAAFIFIAVLRMIWDNPVARGIFAGLIALFCSLNFALNYAPDYVLEWKYDRNTYKVLDWIVQENEEMKPKKLGVYWLFYPSVNYHILERKLDCLDLSEYRDTIPSDSLDYYYGVADEEKALDSMKYEIVEDYGYEKLFSHLEPSGK